MIIVYKDSKWLIAVHNSSSWFLMIYDVLINIGSSNCQPTITRFRRDVHGTLKQIREGTANLGCELLLTLRNLLTFVSRNMVSNNEPPKKVSGTDETIPEKGTTLGKRWTKPSRPCIPLRVRRPEKYGAGRAPECGRS